LVLDLQLANLGLGRVVLNLVTALVFLVEPVLERPLWVGSLTAEKLLRYGLKRDGAPLINRVSNHHTVIPHAVAGDVEAPGHLSEAPVELCVPGSDALLRATVEPVLNTLVAFNEGIRRVLLVVAMPFGREERDGLGLVPIIENPQERLVAAAVRL
jgi:hypothetical protein